MIAAWLYKPETFYIINSKARLIYRVVEQWDDSQITKAEYVAEPGVYILISHDTEVQSTFKEFQ